MPRFSHFRRQKFLAETFRRRRLKKFAGKNINESAVFCLVKMHRDGGGLNKLHRRIALQHTLGEPLDQRFAELFHFYFLAQAVDQTPDFFRRLDELGMAVVEINGSHHPPTLVFVVRLAQIRHNGYII